jgi:hypothetical protein
MVVKNIACIVASALSELKVTANPSPLLSSSIVGCLACRIEQLTAYEPVVVVKADLRQYLPVLPLDVTRGELKATANPSPLLRRAAGP